MAKASLYVPTSLSGARDKGFLGETYYTDENPPFGAVFTYHVRQDLPFERGPIRWEGFPHLRR